MLIFVLKIYQKLLDGFAIVLCIVRTCIQGILKTISTKPSHNFRNILDTGRYIALINQE
jgi:hypothetical protein